MMPPAKRVRQESSFDSLDTSDATDYCDTVDTSSSTESMELDSSQLDPELEADMEQYRKPDASYIELIAKAIMESQGQKLRLQDIYDTLEKKYPYFTVADLGWRNSIRHNLSLHECFFKTERCGNGKGHYWSIHPIHTQDFVSGDFRRRTVKMRARQLHQQQKFQRYQEVPDAAALVSPTVTAPSPSILSPVGQTHFTFPTPFGVTSSPGSHPTLPSSPAIPSSPSLLYSPTSGVFYTAFPFPFVCNGAYPLPSLPVSPSSSGLYPLSPLPSPSGSYPFSSLTGSSSNNILNPFSSLSTMPSSSNTAPQMQPGVMNMSSLSSTPAAAVLPPVSRLQSGATPMSSLPPLPMPPSLLPSTSHLQAGITSMSSLPSSFVTPSAASQLQTGATPMSSLPHVPTRPPVLPPVCCINLPPTSSNLPGTGTLAVLPRSHLPQLHDSLKASPFSIDSILSSQ